MIPVVLGVDPAVWARFSKKVDFDGPNGCWVWTGCRSTDHKGEKTYGSFYYREHMMRAHRLTYEWFVGPIPDGLQIDHLCKNKGCANPAHLEVVTQRENMLRGSQIQRAREWAARITHCPHGHSYAEYGFDDNGHRKCRQCSRIRQRRYSERLRALRVAS